VTLREQIVYDRNDMVNGLTKINENIYLANFLTHQ